MADPRPPRSDEPTARPAPARSRVLRKRQPFIAPESGLVDYQRYGWIELPGLDHVAVHSTPAANLIVKRVDVGLDTPLGRLELGAVYNSAHPLWLWSWDVRCDDIRFVDPSGARFDLRRQSDGMAIPGTHWVRHGPRTMQSKGGRIWHFDGGGRIAHITAGSLPAPRLHHRWRGNRLDLVLENVPDARDARTLATIALGPHGPERVISSTSSSGTGPASVSFGYDRHGRLVEVRSSDPRSPDRCRCRYEYGGRSLSAIVDAQGNRIEYRWDGPLLESVARINARGSAEVEHTFRYDLDPARRGHYRVWHTNPLGGETRILFDAQRRVREILRTQVGEARRISWGQVDRRPERFEDYDGRIWRFREWLNDDPSEIEEPSGNLLRIAYASAGIDLDDPSRRPVARASDLLGSILDQRFDERGQRITRRDGEGEVLAEHVRPLEGRLPHDCGLDPVANPAGPRSGTRAAAMVARVRLLARRASVPRARRDADIELDALGHVRAVGSSTGMREEVRYEPYGRPIEWRLLCQGREAARVSITWRNGRIARCHDAGEDVWEIVAYDPAGRPSRVHELPRGAVRTLTYDLRSRPVRETRTLGGRTRELRIEWDLADRERRILGTSEDGASDIELEFVYAAESGVRTVLRELPREPPPAPQSGSVT
jgi:YD repeat-containing protein